MADCKTDGHIYGGYERIKCIFCGTPKPEDWLESNEAFMRAELTPKAQRQVEQVWELRREAVRLLDVIAAEFKSDPMSVQCFDARTVKRAIEVSEQLKKLDIFGGSF